MKSFILKPRVRRAFSLIELLAVIAIMTILISMIGAPFNEMAAGTNLNRGGQSVGDVIGWARQEATVRNREMQVRFYKLDDDETPGWRGVRIFSRNDDGTYAAVSRLTVLPTSIVMADDVGLSPLILANPEVTGSSSLPGRGNKQYAYAGFRFRPSGMPEQGLDKDNNFVTLINSREKGSSPKNYYVLQIGPVSGRVAVYRP